MRERKNTNKAAPQGGLLSRLLLIFGILLLLIALGVGGYLAWQYLDAQNRYTRIQSIADFDVSQPGVVSTDTKLEDLTFDWEALREINPDIIGWIIVPDTTINYPIVQGDNNEFYLNHLFDLSSSASGAIFADAEGSATLDAQNNIIYGHNMFDGSMFSGVFQYSNQDYFDEHRVLYLCTPQKNIELTALASINITANAPLRQFTFESPEDFSSFVSKTIGQPVASASDMAKLYSEAESLYSLVTCETLDASRRIVLCCVPVRSVVPGE